MASKNSKMLRTKKKTTLLLNQQNKFLLLNKYSSLLEVQDELKKGSLTCIELVNFFLKRIEEHANLNAFVEVFEDTAKKKALAVDIKIKDGSAGKLAGLVISIKDNICYKGHKVSASSKILRPLTVIRSTSPGPAPIKYNILDSL